MKVCEPLSRLLYVGLRWYPPWSYVRPLPFRIWLYSTAHDSESWYWRICGLEINVPWQAEFPEVDPW